MKFRDYFDVIKGNLAKGIANDDLCRLLFGCVIDPLDLRSTSGEPLYYSKGFLSDLLNSKKKMPKQIKENIYEQKVSDTIADYFEQYIVSELVPQHEDICYQIMQLVDADDSIAPESKADLRMLAKTETIAVLLAQVFRYAIRDNIVINRYPTEENKEKQNSSALKIVGIKGSSIDEDFCYIESFVPSGVKLREQYYKEIDLLYEKISQVHLRRHDSSNIMLFGINLSKERVVCSEEQIETLNIVAEKMGRELPDDFYDLGDLTRNPFKSTSVLLGGNNLEGSDEAQIKYHCINELYNLI